MIGGRSAATRRQVAFSFGLGHQWTKRALRLAGPRLPEEAVMLPLSAAEALSVLQDTGARVVLGVVLALGVDVGQTHLDSVKFVSADATIENLLTPRRG